MGNNWNVNYDEEKMREQIQKFRSMFKTKASLKWSLIILVGLFPMLLAWILFGGNDSNKIFNSNSEIVNAIISVSYGFQWLIAIFISIASITSAFFIVKYNKEVKSDIYGNIVAFGFVIINFWLFNIGGWRWLTVFFMYILGYMLAQIFRFVIFLSNTKKKSEEFKNSLNNGQNIFKDFISDAQFNQMQNNYKKNNPNQQDKDQKTNNQQNNKQIDNSKKDDQDPPS